MLAFQMVAARATSMECFRRNQANKLSRTFSTLFEALDRHRDKGGQQRSSSSKSIGVSTSTRTGRRSQTRWSAFDANLFLLVA